MSYSIVPQGLAIFDHISFSIADSGSFHTTENDEKSMPAIICFTSTLNGNMIMLFFC